MYANYHKMSQLKDVAKPFRSQFAAPMTNATAIPFHIAHLPQPSKPSLPVTN